MKVRLVKLDYSGRPWRLVTEDGLQLSRLEPYPGHTDRPLPPVEMPLRWDTKSEGIEALCEMAVRHLETQQALEGYLRAVHDRHADRTVEGSWLGRVLRAAGLRPDREDGAA